MSVSVKGGVARRAASLLPAEPLPGIRLHPELWAQFQELAASPSLTRDGRVPRAQADMLLTQLVDPLRVEIVDRRGSVMAAGQMAGRWATSTGSMLHLGELDADGLCVLSDAAPDALWRLRMVSPNGMSISGSFGFQMSDAVFRWGREAFAQGHKGVFAPSRVSMGTALGAPMPKTPASWRKSTYVYCDSGIAGPEF